MMPLRSPMRRSRLLALLKDSLFGKNLQVLGCVDSTSDRLLALAKRGAAAGTVVTADAQTAGRGRRGTQWVSQRGAGLYVSFLLRDLPAPDDLRLLSSAIGIAIVDTLRAHGVAAQLKWPNDVLVANRKVAGALVDVTSAAGEGLAVIGFGLNVYTPSLPAEQQGALPAIGLAAVQPGPWSREELLASILLRFEEYLVELLAGLREPLRQACLHHDALRGRRVRARSSDEVLEGTVLESDPVKGLVLDVGTEAPRRLDAVRTHLEWVSPS